MSRFLEEARGLTENGSYTEREMIETMIELYERKFRDEKYLLFLMEKLKKGAVNISLNILTILAAF